MGEPVRCYKQFKGELKLHTQESYTQVNLYIDIKLVNINKAIIKSIPSDKLSCLSIDKNCVYHIHFYI